MIFTGQVWNMTFSFYGSLRAIPLELREAARVYRFGWWKTFRTLEVPAAMIGLVWNSMMSMAGGWFFLTVNEAFTLGDHDFRLPGIGSYMSVAIDRGDARAMAAATVAMIVMIVVVDQLVWRPALAWAQKFKLEDTEADEAPTLVGARPVAPLARHRLGRDAPWLACSPGATADAPPRSMPRRLTIRRRAAASRPDSPAAPSRPRSRSSRCAGAAHLLTMLRALTAAEWLHLAAALGLTFLRTYAALALGALWTVPVGIWIGLSPARTRILQPIIQVAAAFPAPMIFPLVTLAILAAGVPFSWGCVALMLLGSQWYILFNVLAGAGAMPHDLREVAEVCGLGRWARWRTLYLPAIVPYLVTGLITAAGGAWNASIVAEYVRYRGETLIAPGLGSLITTATAAGNFPLLAAGVLTMSLGIVAINRTVWRRLGRFADARFSLNR